MVLGGGRKRSLHFLPPLLFFSLSQPHPHPTPPSPCVVCYVRGRAAAESTRDVVGTGWFFFSPPSKKGSGKGGRWCSRRGWIAEGSIVVVVVVEYMYTASSRLAGWTITCVEREPSEDSISRERRSGHS